MYGRHGGWGCQAMRKATKSKQPTHTPVHTSCSRLATRSTSCSSIASLAAASASSDDAAAPVARASSAAASRRAARRRAAN